jgi:hypothetical protein
MGQQPEVGSTIREAAVVEEVVVEEEEGLMIAPMEVDLEVPVARQRYDLFPLSFFHI